MGPRCNPDLRTTGIDGMPPKVRFAADSPVEGGGFEPSVPRQKARSRCWHPDDHRRNAPPKVRFATDSPLEGDGFEPSVPHENAPFWLPPVVPAILLPQQKPALSCRAPLVRIHLTP